MRKPSKIALKIALHFLAVLFPEKLAWLPGGTVGSSVSFSPPHCYLQHVMEAAIRQTDWANVLPYS